MESEVVRGIGLIVLLGIGLQWVARRLGVPSIVLLLVGGLVVGPGLDLVDPELIFGESAVPDRVVGRRPPAVQRGPGLDLAELRGGARRPVIRLVTIGTLITWLLGASPPTSCSTSRCGCRC